MVGKKKYTYLVCFYCSFHLNANANCILWWLEINIIIFSILWYSMPIYVWLSTWNETVLSLCLQASLLPESCVKSGVLDCMSVFVDEDLTSPRSVNLSRSLSTTLSQIKFAFQSLKWLSCFRCIQNKLCKKRNIIYFWVE